MEYYEAQPGDVVYVWVGPFRHFGIVTDRLHSGQNMIISNSLRAGGVREEPWDVFAGGRRVHADRREAQMPVWQVLQRARSGQGTKWRVGWNCEHFVNESLGRVSTSPQLRAAVTAVTALLAVAVLPRR